MTNKEAIERLKELWLNIKNVDDREALIKSVKSLMNERKWIKISEKRPPSYGLYIVIVEKIDYFGDNYICADACFYDGVDTWYNAKSYDDNKKLKKGQVLAWRLFPKVESEDLI